MVPHLTVTFLIGISCIGISKSQEFKGKEHQSSCGASNIVSSGDVFIFTDFAEWKKEPDFGNGVNGMSIEISENDGHSKQDSSSLAHLPQSFLNLMAESKNPEKFKMPAFDRNLENYNDLTEGNFNKDSSSSAYVPESVLNLMAQSSNPEKYKMPTFDRNFQKYDGNDREFLNDYETNSFTRPRTPGISPYSPPDYDFLRNLEAQSRSRVESSPNQGFEHALSMQYKKLTFNAGKSHGKSVGNEPVPKLFTEYFKTAEAKKEDSFGDDMAGGRNYHKKGKKKETEVNIFTLMDKAYKKGKRQQRSIRGRIAALKQLALKSSKKAVVDKSKCEFKYSAGSGCQNLVVHIVSGDTAKMSCDREHLRFREDSDVTYCGSTRHHKTSVYGKELFIEHFKKPGTSGEKFKGYVVCNYSKLL